MRTVNFRVLKGGRLIYLVYFRISSKEGFEAFYKLGVLGIGMTKEIVKAVKLAFTMTNVCNFFWDITFFR
jgi:hypothetical protein